MSLLKYLLFLAIAKFVDGYKIGNFLENLF